MTTTYFVAEDSELLVCFPDWLPVAAQKNREVINPHTGEKQLDWGPESLAAGHPLKSKSFDFKSWLVEFIPSVIQFIWPGSSLFTQRPVGIANLPYQAQFSDIDIVKMAILQEILCSISFDSAMNAWDRPVLLNLETDEENLYMFPPMMTRALSALDPEQITRLAQYWAGTEELRLDNLTFSYAKKIILSLHSLAVAALAGQKNLYLWWRL